MNDLFEFMLGKKDNKKSIPTAPQEKNNYSIYMPVGVYEGEQDDVLEYTKKDAASEQSEGRRGDFNPYVLEKMKNDEQLVELKRQISSMEDEIRGLKDKIVELKNANSELSVEKSKYEYVASTYRSMIEKIVKIMPYYQEIEFTGVGSPEQWVDRKLVEIFVTCVENIKIDYNKKIKENEMLKSSVRKQDNSDSAQSSMEIPEIEIPDGLNDEILNNSIDNSLNSLNDNLDIFSGDYNVDIPGMNVEVPSATETTVSVIDSEYLQKYIEKINGDNQLKIILETIGETGLSRVAELKETDVFKRTFTNSNGEFVQGSLSRKLKDLSDIEVIDVEQINTGRKGGGENIYSLSETGRKVYKMLFSANPVESEKEKIRRQHTSLEHGYFIKTVGKELENKGYEVFDSPEDCIRIPLVANDEGDSKLRVEADLIIKKGDTEYVIECEMGTTSDSDMNKKLDKLILVTNTISFIMNNQESLNKTLTKVDKWITKKGRDNLKGYTFRFTTLDTLKKKEFWQNKGPF